MTPNMLSIARAVIFAVVFISLTGAIGMPLALWLKARRWSNFPIASAPVFGWTILTSWCYFFLSFMTFFPALLILYGVIFIIFSLSLISLPDMRREAKHLMTRSVLLFPAALFILYIFVISPYLIHNTLSIVVPNQDEEYFVEIADMFWASPQGSRLLATGYHLETGWGFHVAIALARVIPFVHAFEAVMLVGYATLPLMGGGVFVLVRERLRMPMAWSIAIAVVAPLHSLVLWVPGYAFGPNAVAAAIVPWYATALLKGFSRPSTCNGVVLSLTSSMLVMAYTKVTAIQLACVGIGIAAVGAWHATTGTQSSIRRSAAGVIGWHLLGAIIGFGSIADSFIWLFREGITQALKLLSDSAETTGAGWNVSTFPGIGTWLGTEPWDFLQARLGLGGEAWLDSASLLGTVAGVMFAIIGLSSPSLREWRMGAMTLVLGHLFFYAYARIFKAFPYAVFKLQSLSGVLLVVLVFVGMHDVLTGSRRGDHELLLAAGMRAGFRTLARYARIAGAAAYLIAFGLASTVTFAFYLIPFGVTIPSATVDELGRIVNRIPAKAMVEVSGQIRGTVDAGSFSPTTHPIGFTKPSEASRATGDRIRAYLAHSLRMRDIDPFGVFGRQVNSTVRIPAGERAEYLISGAAEDSRIRGLSVDHTLELGETLRLIAQPPTTTQGVYLLSGSKAATWTVRCTTPVPSAPCPMQSSVVGLFASGPTVVEFDLACEATQRRAQVLLRRGFAWYRTGPHATPCTVAARLTNESAGAKAWVATSSTGQPAQPPELSRADRTTGAVHAAVGTDGSLDITVAIASAMAETEPQRLRVSLVASPIGAGQRIATDADPSRPYQEWRWVIAAGRPIIQYIDGQNIPMPLPAPWMQDDGELWVRLAFTEGLSSWHEVPFLVGKVSQGSVTEFKVVSALFEVPMLHEGDSQVMPVDPSWRVVRGSGDRMYAVEQGALRWIPDLETFARRGLQWGDVITIPDSSLDSIPLGLPLE